MSIPPEIISILLSNGLAGVGAILFFTLWRNSEAKRETENKEYSKEIKTSYETRIAENKEAFKALAENKTALENFAKLIDAKGGKI